MGSMMTGLYVGLSGLVTSSNSLNTTANNLSNVNTDGYVRQQVVDKDMMYNDVTTHSNTNQGQSGLGVTVQEIAHVRDMFLDLAYRKETGRESFYSKLYDAVYEIETQVGNTDGIDGIAFQSSITNLLTSLNTLSEAPGDLVYRSAVVQSAVEFLDSAKLIYNGLQDYQETLNDEIIGTIDRINEIGDSIKLLNTRIEAIEVGGIENANDLRDQRDALIDELASYCKISYKEDANGVVEVSVEGTPFVDELSVNYLGYEIIEGTTDFVNPVWSQMNNQPLYNLNATISTETNTDIGGLKGLVVARGNISPTAHNMTEPDAADYALGTADPDYINDLDAYNRYESSYGVSTIVNTMANLDKLVGSIVEAINDVFCPETTYTAADGTVYTVLDTENAPTAKDGTPGVELFSRDYTDRYTEQVIDGQTMWVRNNTNSFGNPSYYSISNVTVNDTIVNDYSKMALTTLDGADDYNTVSKLVALFSDAEGGVSLYYNGGIDGLTFEKFYETLTSDIATTGSIYKSMSTNEDTLKESIDSARQEVMGVSSDDELSNMIRYQQAYNAASRYINVVSDMIETLIMNTGA